MKIESVSHAIRQRAQGKEPSKTNLLPPPESNLVSSRADGADRFHPFGRVLRKRAPSFLALRATKLRSRHRRSDLGEKNKKEWRESSPRWRGARGTSLPPSRGPYDLCVLCPVGRGSKGSIRTVFEEGESRWAVVVRWLFFLRSAATFEKGKRTSKETRDRLSQGRNGRKGPFEDPGDPTPRPLCTRNQEIGSGSSSFRLEDLGEERVIVFVLLEEGRKESIFTIRKREETLGSVADRTQRSRKEGDGRTSALLLWYVVQDGWRASAKGIL